MPSLLVGSYTFVADGITAGYSFFVRSSTGGALGTEYQMAGGPISGATGSFSFTVPYVTPETNLVYYAVGTVRALPTQAPSPLGAVLRARHTRARPASHEPLMIRPE